MDPPKHLKNVNTNWGRAMKQRDKAILSDLERFRCMTRDDIIELHFSNVKNQITCCNTVLKRLRRDQLIDVNASQQPYLYFPHPSPIKKNSQKIPHFLAIVDFYKQLHRIETPAKFMVEPKFGYVEPDVFCIWRGKAYFIEIQRSVYSTKVMMEKIRRYEQYYHQGDWGNLYRDGDRGKKFPEIWIITRVNYRIEKTPFRIIQSKNVDLGMEHQHCHLKRS